MDISLRGRGGGKAIKDAIFTGIKKEIKKEIKASFPN